MEGFLDFVDYSKDDGCEKSCLKCGEILIINNKDIHFRCSYCLKEIQNIEMFLRHIFECHITLSTVEAAKDVPSACIVKPFLKEEQDEKIELFLDVALPKEELNEQNVVDCIAQESITQESIKRNDRFSHLTLKKSKKTTLSKKCKQIDEKIHFCEYCAAKFRDRSNLAEHIKRHLGIKPHRCNLCGKRFTSSPELRMHMRSHTGEKPYECDECDKKYAHPYRLLAHRRRHRNERPYQCKSCDKSFFDNQRLRDHEVAHRSVRPFSCEICGSTFKRKSDLKTHLKIHSDIKEYTCEICNKSYAQYAGLYSHMKQH